MAGEWEGSVTKAWTLDLGSCSVMRRQNQVGTASASMTIHGAIMRLVAYTGGALEGLKECETTEWESETSVRCLVTHGARDDRRIKLDLANVGADEVSVAVRICE